MASIRTRKRKDPKTNRTVIVGYQAQVRMTGWEPLTRTFKVKADAQQWAKEREADMLRGTHIDTKGLKAMTLHDLLARYLEEVSPTHKGQDVEQIRLRAMMRTPMAALSLDQVTSAVILEWRAKRSSRVKGDTVRREMNLLSSVFSHARSEWQVPITNPVTTVKRPKQGSGRDRRPSWSELRRLLRELTPRLREDGYWIGSRNAYVRSIVLLGLRTAMRRSELLGMRWELVNWSGQHVRLPDTKNGTTRDVPFGRKAMLIMERIHKGEKSGHVFPTTVSAFKQAFADAMERSGVEDLRFHDFRHDATTRLAGQLTNVLELSAVTGHKTLSMLKRYYNPTPLDLARKIA